MKKKNEQFEGFLLDTDNKGKFHFEYEGTPFFIIKSIIRLFEFLIEKNEKIGYVLLTGVLDGLCTSDKIDMKKVKKELDSIED